MTSCFTYIFDCVKIELVHSDYFFVYDFVQNHFDLGSHYGFFLLIVQVHYTTNSFNKFSKEADILLAKWIA